MTICLPQVKAMRLLKLCQDTLLTKNISLRELASLIGKLYSTLPSLAAAPLQVRELQQDLGSDKGPEEPTQLWGSNKLITRGKKGTELVGKQHNNNGGFPSEIRQPGHGDVLRCIIRPGLGSILGRGAIHRGYVDQSREGIKPYKCS